MNACTALTDTHMSLLPKGSLVYDTQNARHEITKQNTSLKDKHLNKVE